MSWNICAYPQNTFHMLYSAIFRASSDYGALKKHHALLLDAISWKLSTPSNIVSVLHVLLRSGTLVTGMDRVADPSIGSLFPCMTKDERSTIGRFADALSTRRIRPLTGSNATVQEPTSLRSSSKANLDGITSCSSLDQGGVVGGQIVTNRPFYSRLPLLTFFSRSAATCQQERMLRFWY